MMTRDQLEAEIWQLLGEFRAENLSMTRAVDQLLQAADHYAATEVGFLTPAERRRVLGQATQ